MTDGPRTITPSQTVGPFYSFCLTRPPPRLSPLGDHRLITPDAHGTPKQCHDQERRYRLRDDDEERDQHHGHLRHAVPDRTDPQWASLAIRFGDEHASHRLGAVRLGFQVRRQFVQPPVQPVRLDVLERLAVDPRRAVVGTTAGVGPPQHVPSVHLVEQRVEPIAGRPLRFGVQRLLEFLNLRRRW